MKLLAIALLLFAPSLAAIAEVCEDSNTDCANLAYLCDDPGLRDGMHKRCPKTCGVCVDPVCADAIWNCTALDCLRPELDDYMASNCAATCGYCPDSTGDCKDRLRDCAQFAENCYDYELRNGLAERCPETCGYCGKYNVCEDIATDCAELSQYCQNANYSSYMRDNCAKTCAFCRNWVRYPGTGYWYKYLCEESWLWQDVESVCIGLGGHLVSIHSQAENDFVFGLMRLSRLPHIGLHGADDSLSWSDGTPVDYQNWRASRTGEGCAKMYSDSYSGKWGWSACNKYWKGICKKRSHNAATA